MWTGRSNNQHKAAGRVLTAPSRQSATAGERSLAATLVNISGEVARFPLRMLASRWTPARDGARLRGRRQRIWQRAAGTQLNGQS
jgi:hypothetical protein